jgi:hypothetical protein
MFNTTNLKYVIIPFIIFILIITALAFLTLRSKSTLPSQNSPLSPSSTPFPSPSPYILNSDATPTLIPLRFTGADLTKDIPADVKAVSDQKTVLRRLTPLTMPFGTVEFDYENDNFLVRLFDPKEASRLQFDAWRGQTYPSLTNELFSFN